MSRWIDDVLKYSKLFYDDLIEVLLLNSKLYSSFSNADCVEKSLVKASLKWRILFPSWAQLNYCISETNQGWEIWLFLRLKFCQDKFIFGLFSPSVKQVKIYKIINIINAVCIQHNSYFNVEPDFFTRRLRK